MSEIRWSKIHDKIIELNGLDEYSNDSVTDHLTVLHDGVRAEDAIKDCTLKTSMYVEYMHWQDRFNTLDGFVDHNGNMVVINGDYNNRKAICGKLFDRYKTHQLIRGAIKRLPLSHWICFTSNTATCLRTATIPSLHGHAILQWRSTDDILADDIVKIDICKAYLSVLLHNTTPMPIYSIHDKVEPFRCKSDLSHCREFYLDTTTIHNHKTPITIEAGWYSANLVKHLVEGLNMPTASIKYKLSHEAYPKSRHL